MTLMDKLRALLAEAEADGGAGEAEIVADPPAEDPPAEDPPAEDPPAEDPPAEDPPAEDPPAEDPPAGEDPEGGGVEEPAEVAELRQTIIEQAAVIETQRNRLAELGVEDIDPDPTDDTIELDDEDVVADFDTDYALREAELAALLEGKN
jgi:hypothetical protein